MVDVKRVVLLILVAGLIVTAGLYWNSSLNEYSPSESTSVEQTNQESFDASDWNVTPEATVSLDDSEEVPADDTYGRFTVPGKVTFGKNTAAQSIGLTVKIMPVEESRAAELANQSGGDDPIAQLMKGDPRESFDTKPITKTITTDSTGRFSIENAIPGIYQVLVEDTGLVKTDSTSRIEIASRIRPLGLEVSRTATLEGTVRGPDGEPLQATVEYKDGRDRFQTNEQGQFTVDDVPPGKKIDFLRIFKDGYREHHLSLPAPEPGETIKETFTLEKGSSLQVRVRTQNGEPVTDGTVILTREDDKEIPFGARQSVPHGKGRAVQLDGNGQATFQSIIPGRVKVQLMFANLLVEPRVLEIETGEDRRITLTGQRGESFNIKFLDESTGQPVEGIKPAMRVFDEDGNELEPGFIISSRKKNDAYEGVVDPGAETLRVRVTSPTNAYQTKEVEFERSDLPNLTVSLVPSKRPTPEPETPPGLTTFELQNEDLVDWNTVDSVSVWILDPGTGEQVLARTGGGNSVLSEPYPLQIGKYLVYAVFKGSEENTRVAFRRIEINSKHPGSRTLSLEEAASVEGSIQPDQGSASNYQVGISLLGERDDDVAEGASNVFYPDTLRTSPSNSGSFRLDNIPPGVSTALHVTATGQGSSDRAAGSVLKRHNLPQLSPGQLETIGPIQLSE